ncbi:phage tail protein [Pantanalinema rosaneae CENA516]|uniref:phage tail protein n=1 Tax=Pantanalinema rosaneae TaxID=1620701 RepID=UPI003D6E4EA3
MNAPSPDDELSSLLNYLPAIYQTEDPGNFLGKFLLVFEDVLLGRQDTSPPGLEQTIASIFTLLDPESTREEFLPWLAGWVALTLRSDWDIDRKRRLIANVIPLYRHRGTADNLKTLLTIYTGGLSPDIQEPEDEPFQIRPIDENPLQLGVSTRIGGSIPYYFRVILNLPIPDKAEQQRQYDIVSALVDLQKPAHTFYDLEIRLNTMRIDGDPPGTTPHSNDPIQVGVNTLLGQIPNL